MPSTSVYLPEDVLQGIDERRGEDQSRSDWITKALRRELESEHDELEDIERRVEAIEQALVRSAMYDQEPAEYLDKVQRVFGSEHGYMPSDELEAGEDSSERDS